MARVYTAAISGHSWSRGPVAQFRTVRACRAYAESYGTTADRCTITDASGRVVGVHRRDTGGDGFRWFRQGVTQRVVQRLLDDVHQLQLDEARQRLLDEREG